MFLTDSSESVRVPGRARLISGFWYRTGQRPSFPPCIPTWERRRWLFRNLHGVHCALSTHFSVLRLNDESPARLYVCEGNLLAKEAQRQLQYRRAADLEKRIQFARNQ